MYKGLTKEQTTKVVKMLSDFCKRKDIFENIEKINTETWEDYKEINKIITYILREDLGNATGLNEPMGIEV
mgnify:CR=1 FL=1